MPYSNISELPQSVREAVPSYAGRAMFRAVVNSQMSAGKTESVAFASAWAALQRAGYEKAESGEWIKKAESYDAPDSARNNARKAIAWREKYGDDVKGGTIVGWTRASQLASGEKLSLSTVKRMAMFNRHRSNSEVAPEYKGEPWKDAGHVAWLLWGGTSGVDWARGISGRVTKSAEEEDMDDLTAEKNAEIRDLLAAEWNLGPSVVAPPNDEYWTKMAEVWMIDEAQARRQLCANCEYFDNTPEALESMESVPEDRFDADGGGRGYCHKFHFICHNLRACQAWEGMDYEIEKSAGDSTPLYGYRPLLNAQELVDWAKSNGYETTLTPEDMHVTVVYSKTPLPMPNNDGATWGLGTVVVRGGNRRMMSLGDGSASVLVLDSVDLISEWNHYRSMGASWDYPSYMPHVTISYSGGPTDMAPFTGDLVFGPIEFEPIRPKASDSYVEKRQYNDDVFTDRLGAMGRSAEIGLDGYVHQVTIDGQSMFRPGVDEDSYIRAVYGENITSSEKQGLLGDAIRAILQVVMDNETQYSSSVKIIKMDDEQRVVWGWASVATEDGKAVFDVHGDHIPMSELTKASIDFMENVRVGKSLHQGEQTSSVIGCLPLSQELAKALGIETTREGLIMGFRVHDDATWGLIKSGELPALSIGGRGRKYAV